MSHHRHPSFIKEIKKMTKFERFVTAIIVVEPIVAIPQVIKIFSLQSAKEFFIWRWVFGFTAAVVMVTYGFKIRKMPIIFGSGIWVLVHGSMLLGILLYG